jgi:hypothetical protein
MNPAAEAQPSQSKSIPYLRRQGSATQLVVEGKPFLILGGELHNSSSSSLAYMEPIWESLADLPLNTVLAPVSWELIEPEEGIFDFALVDGLLDAARRHGLRLIVLWFGSWKNGMSSYVPAWVKGDDQRFPRARRVDGDSVEVLSTFAEANVAADARAFAALMRHLRQVDGDRQTVIMVQVENEVGLLGDSRDWSEPANHAFIQPVPADLIADLPRHDPGSAARLRWEAAGSSTTGTWDQVFGSGPGTDEIFMAWHYARYVDRVAAAGKAEYKLPMLVNAWLSVVVAGPALLAGGDKPGDWPSGGPVAHLLDVWHVAAPHVDVLSPDIYFGDFAEWCRLYTRRGNPLLFPEMRRDAEGARNVWVALGAHDAIGVSPFGIDSLDSPEDAPLRASYRLLRQIAPLILEHQGNGTMVGFVLDGEHSILTRRLGDYDLEISLDHAPGLQTEHGYGLVIATGPNRFLGAGFGFRVAFRPATPGQARAGIAAVDEGEFRDGVWSPLRRLNGDETWSGSAWRFPPPATGPSVFPIPVLGPGTGISRCTVYRYG